MTTRNAFLNSWSPGSWIRRQIAKENLLEATRLGQGSAAVELIVMDAELEAFLATQETKTPPKGALTDTPRRWRR